MVLRRLKASIYGGSKIITVTRGEKLPTADLYYIAFIVVVDDVRECRIDEWREAGLSKPTSVRLDKVLRLQESDLDGKIGELQERDKLIIRLRLSKR